MDTPDHSTGAKSTIMKFTGVALLWAGLAALVYVPTSGGGPIGTLVAGLGFGAFAVGVMLFAGSLKDEIVRELRDGGKAF